MADALFTVGRPLEQPGRHELALLEAAAAASLADRYGAGVSAARAAARAIDDAELAGRPQVVAQLLRSYVDVLERLHLLPPVDGHGQTLSSSEGSGAQLLALVASDGAGAG